MRYRKNFAWGLVLAVALGLVLVLVSLWVQSAGQRSLDERVAEAEGRCKEAERHTLQVMKANPPMYPPEAPPGGWKTEEERERAWRLAWAENKAREGVIQKAADEERERRYEYAALEREQQHRNCSWPGRLRFAIRHYTGR